MLKRQKRPLGAGQILSTSLRVLFANLVPYLLFAALAFAPTVLLWNALSAVAGDNAALVGAVVVLVSLTLQMVVTATVTYSVVQTLAGDRPSIGESLREGLGRLPPVAGVAIVTGIAIWAGLACLIVPGLILACGWYVAVPAALVEGTGIRAALRRSVQLTDGYRGQICSLVVLVLVAGELARQYGRVDLRAATGRVTMSYALSTGSALVSLYGSVLQAVTYTRLRGLRDGIDIEKLAALFD